VGFVAEPGVGQRWSHRRSVSQFRQMTTLDSSNRRLPDGEEERLYVDHGWPGRELGPS
jgi:hypothetical protein